MGKPQPPTPALCVGGPLASPKRPQWEKWISFPVFVLRTNEMLALDSGPSLGTPSDWRVTGDLIMHVMFLSIKAPNCKLHLLESFYVVSEHAESNSLLLRALDEGHVLRSDITQVIWETYRGQKAQVWKGELTFLIVKNMSQPSK